MDRRHHGASRRRVIVEVAGNAVRQSLMRTRFSEPRHARQLIFSRPARAWPRAGRPQGLLGRIRIRGAHFEVTSPACSSSRTPGERRCGMLRPVGKVPLRRAAVPTSASAVWSLITPARSTRRPNATSAAPRPTNPPWSGESRLADSPNRHASSNALRILAAPYAPRGLQIGQAQGGLPCALGM